ncbi:hypothetical protein [Domibacillus aminovorans]|uniref:DUF559 domain-containing protein n=1 Tax=Domibacillus aminovorans TaxID=29332 RepID=A0A177LD16_9BACI|nr:hypothetical protein [Domibacillus aminovorans]OAH63276.1 hypothetical protein AWH49_00005 [Domibacillus aminovorans]
MTFYKKRDSVIYTKFLTLPNINFPSYVHKFGGIKKICQEIGIPYLFYNQISREDILKDLQRVYCEQGEISKTTYENHGIYACIVVRREFGGFNKAFELIGAPINMHKKISKNDLLDDIKLFCENNHTTSSTAYRKRGKYSQPTIDRYGGWCTLLKEVGLKPSNEKIGLELMKIEILALFNEHGFISRQLINDNCSFKYQALRYHLGGRKEISKFLGVDNAFLKRISTNAQLIENIIKKHFGDKDLKSEKTWKWLINPKTGNHLYADIYIKSLNLVIEYDGEQHFKYIPYFHKTFERYLEQVKRDEIKTNLLCEKKVPLIRFRFDDEITEKSILAKLFPYLN